MPYPEEIVQPMRQELTRLGLAELRSAGDVDTAFDQSQTGTLFVVLNSVCGCAAANARPAVALAMHSPVRPDHMATVFAGQDMEATAALRERLVGIPPSSPFMALFKDGEPVFVVERRHIEGRSASAIASDLMAAFNRFCQTNDVPSDGPERPEVAPDHDRGLPPTFRSIL